MDDSLYREVSQSIKAVFDLTARVDERVKMLVEKQSAIERRIDYISHSQSDLTTKVGILETKNGSDVKKSVEAMQDQLQKVELRLLTVERAATSSDQRWKLVFDFVYKTAWIILVCYLLYKLNLQAPPIP